MINDMREEYLNKFNIPTDVRFGLPLKNVTYFKFLNAVNDNQTT